jgi:hypothetical protein
MADTLTARQAPAPPAPDVPSNFTFDAIGTRWCIDTDEPLRGEVCNRILDRIRRFDRTYSRLAETHRFAYVRMLADGRAERSPDFDGELFTRAPTPRRRRRSGWPTDLAQRQGRT